MGSNYSTSQREKGGGRGVREGGRGNKKKNKKKKKKIDKTYRNSKKERITYVMHGHYKS